MPLNEIQPGPKKDSYLRILLGCLAVFASAFGFYFSTVTIRWSQPVVDIDPAFFAFARFLLGFAVVCLLCTLTAHRPKPKNYHHLLGRTITNCIAVFCFYQAVELTSVAEANILNMTYPIFVAIFSWIILRHQRDILSIGFVLIAFIGIWLILDPRSVGIDINNLWGLASGISASLSIIYLNISRQQHDTRTVLFFMFGVGLVIMTILFHHTFFWPDRTALYYLFLCSVFGIAGQFLLTVGFRYVTAVEGGIISSSRILLAAFLGPFLVSENSLSVWGWLGSILIFSVNVALTIRKKNHK
jgi:drug/metabolite transporter (DMT)-like permease